MKTFNQWIAENDYNNFGVPYYADPNTPAIRGPAEPSNQGWMARTRAKLNQKNIRIGQLFQFIPPSPNHAKYGDAVCTVTSVGNTNIGYSITGEKHKKSMLADNFRFVKLID